MALTSEICDYDKDSPLKFNAEKKLIEQELGILVHDIQHVGSTSIVGIKAKPEIDLLVVVKSVDPIDPINKAMLALGYDIRGECEIPGRHYFSKNMNAKRTHKAHVCIRNHRLVQELIVFRDYLLDHPDEVRVYESLKLRLADSNLTGTREYLDGKENYIREIIQRAIGEGYGG